MLDATTLSRRFSLTLREGEILAHVANGADNATIAATLAIGEQSVKNALRSIGRAMNETGGSARVRMALRAHGIMLA